MHVTCERCETEYSTDREPPSPGMNTQRCPQCGWEFEPDDETGEASPCAVADGSPAPEQQIPAPVTVDVPERVLEEAAAQLAAQGDIGRGAAAERLLDYLNLRFTYRTTDGDDAVRVVLERARERRG
jgi:hypothetical protein